MRCVVFHSNMFNFASFGSTHPTTSSQRNHTHYYLDRSTSCTLFFKSGSSTIVRNRPPIWMWGSGLVFHSNMFKFSPFGSTHPTTSSLRYHNTTIWFDQRVAIFIFQIQLQHYIEESTLILFEPIWISSGSGSARSVGRKVSKPQGHQVSGSHYQYVKISVIHQVTSLKGRMWSISRCYHDPGLQMEV